MITYDELLKEIRSPITGSILKLMDKDYPNENTLVVDEIDGKSIIAYDSPLAMYLKDKDEKKEAIYVPYNEN